MSDPISNHSAGGHDIRGIEQFSRTDETEDVSHPASVEEPALTSRVRQAMTDAMEQSGSTTPSHAALDVTVQRLPGDIAGLPETGPSQQGRTSSPSPSSSSSVPPVLDGSLGPTHDENEALPPEFHQKLGECLHALEGAIHSENQLKQLQAEMQSEIDHAQAALSHATDPEDKERISRYLRGLSDQLDPIRTTMSQHRSQHENALADLMRMASDNQEFTHELQKALRSQGVTLPGPSSFTGNGQSPGEVQGTLLTGTPAPALTVPPIEPSALDLREALSQLLNQEKMIKAKMADINAIGGMRPNLGGREYRAKQEEMKRLRGELQAMMGQAYQLQEQMKGRFQVPGALALQSEEEKRSLMDGILSGKVVFSSAVVATSQPLTALKNTPLAFPSHQAQYRLGIKKLIQQQRNIDNLVHMQANVTEKLKTAVGDERALLQQQESWIADRIETVVRERGHNRNSLNALVKAGFGDESDIVRILTQSALPEKFSGRVQALLQARALAEAVEVKHHELPDNADLNSLYGLAEQHVNRCRERVLEVINDPTLAVQKQAMEDALTVATSPAVDASHSGEREFDAQAQPLAEIVSTAQSHMPDIVKAVALSRADSFVALFPPEVRLAIVAYGEALDRAKEADGVLADALQLAYDNPNSAQRLRDCVALLGPGSRAFENCMNAYCEVLKYSDTMATASHLIDRTAKNNFVNDALREPWAEELAIALEETNMHAEKRYHEDLQQGRDAMRLQLEQLSHPPEGLTARDLAKRRETIAKGRANITKLPRGEQQMFGWLAQFDQVQLVTNRIGRYDMLLSNLAKSLPEGDDKNLVREVHAYVCARAQEVNDSTVPFDRNTLSAASRRKLAGVS